MMKKISSCILSIFMLAAFTISSSAATVIPLLEVEASTSTAIETDADVQAESSVESDLEINTENDAEAEFGEVVDDRLMYYLVGRDEDDNWVDLGYGMHDAWYFWGTYQCAQVIFCFGTEDDYIQLSIDDLSVSDENAVVLTDYGNNAINIAAYAFGTYSISYTDDTGLLYSLPVYVQMSDVCYFSQPEFNQSFYLHEFVVTDTVRTCYLVSNVGNITSLEVDEDFVDYTEVDIQDNYAAITFTNIPDCSDGYLYSKVIIDRSAEDLGDWGAGLGLSLVFQTGATEEGGGDIVTPEQPEDSNLLDSGVCGENLTWTLTTDGILTISGIGAMTDYDLDSSWEPTTPWFDYADIVTEVIVEDGVTTIGAYAFNCMTSLESIFLPDGITTIGYSSFNSCDSMVSIEIPSTVYLIDDEAFSWNSQLSEITFLGDAPLIATYAFTWVHAVCYYPADNTTWDESVRCDYDGTLTWVGYNDSGIVTEPSVLNDYGLLSINSDLAASGDGWEWTGKALFLDGSHENFAVNAIRFSGLIEYAYIMLDANTTLDTTNLSALGEYIPVIEMRCNESTLDIITGEYSLTINGVESYTDGIYTRGSLYISDSTLLVSANGVPIHVENGNLDIFNSYVFTSGCNYDGIEVQGIRDSVEGNLLYFGNLTICDSTVSSIDSGSNAIYCDGDMTIACSDVTATTLNGNNGFGNDCGNILITDSTIYVDADNIGICTYGTITVSNSIATVEGDEIAIRVGSREESDEEIASVTDLTLMDCEIVTPTNGVIVSAAYQWSEDSYETIVTIDDNDDETDGWITFVEIGFTDQTEEPVVLPSGTCGDNLFWSLNDGVLTVSGTGAMADCSGYSAPWNAYYSDIREVIIEEGVTTISPWAFAYCDQMTQVSLPSSLVTIDYGAFVLCSSLETIIIPENVTLINSQAFTNCTALTEVIFLGDAPQFNEEMCPGLDSFTYVVATCYYPANNSTWTSDIMLDYGGTLTWEPWGGEDETPDDDVVVITSGVCGDNLAWTITSHTDESGIYYALNIDGTGEMYNYAYKSYPDWYQYKGYIRRVCLSDGVTTIGDFAFFDLENMVYVDMPDSIVSLGQYAFWGCSALTDLHFSTALEYIGEYCFLYCSLETVSFGDALTSIGMYAFSDCDKLTEVVLPSSVTTLGQGAFCYSTALERVDLGGNVEYLDYFTFSGCSALSEVLSMDSVCTINNYAFNETKLNSVIIPANVSLIGDYAFADCPELTEITFLGDAPTFGEYVFSNVIATCYYPSDNDTWTEDVMQNYEGVLTWLNSDGEDGGSKLILSGSCGTTLVWTLTEKTDEAGDSYYALTINGSGQMNDYSETLPDWYKYRDLIRVVSLPSEITLIGNFAFEGLTQLTSITIPDNVYWIGEYAFANCTALEQLELGYGLACISSYAFYNCTSLNQLTVHGETSFIGDNAFANCTALENVTLEEGVMYLDEYAFSNCIALTKLVFPDSLTTVGCSAFSYCTALESIQFGPNLITIKALAFSKCSSLSQITFHCDAPTIEESAFYGVTATCYYPADDRTWNENTMLDYDGTLTWVVIGGVDVPEEDDGDIVVPSDPILLSVIAPEDGSRVWGTISLTAEASVNEEDVPVILSYTIGGMDYTIGDGNLFTIDTSDMPEGEYLILTFTATDSTGNAVSKALTYQVNNLPAVPNDLAAEITASGIVLSWTAPDPEDNVSSYHILRALVNTDGSIDNYYEIGSVAAEGNTTYTYLDTLEDRTGSYSYQISVMGVSGQSSYCKPVLVVFDDSVAPVVTYFALTDESTVYGGPGEKAAINYSVQSKDNVEVTRVVMTFVSKNGASMQTEFPGGTFTGFMNAYYMSSDEWTMTVVAYDAAGNQSEPVSVSFTVDNIAPTAPVFSLKESYDQVTLTWESDTTGDTVAYRIERDGMELATVDCIQNYYHDTTAESGMKYTYCLVAIDQVGNEAASDTVVGCRLMDEEAPTIKDIWPREGESVTFCYSGSIELLVCDNWKLDRAELYVQGNLVSFQTLDGTDRYVTLDWDVSTLSGTQEFTVVVTDAAGNTAKSSASVNVRAYSAPEAPTDLTVSGTFKSATLNWTYTGDLMTLKQFKVYSCDAVGGNAVLLNNVKNYKYTVRNLERGTHYFMVAAEDIYGEISKYVLVDVYLDNTDTQAPVVAILPKEPLGVEGISMDFSGVESTDNDAIVSYVWDFGDGTTGVGVNCNHTYQQPGTYTARLTVTDASGNTASMEKTVAILDITGADATHTIVTVNVLDGYVDGTPVIANATVSIYDEEGFETTALTDENGQVTLIVPNGVCNIAAAADGYTASGRKILVQGDEAGRISITVYLAGSSVKTVDGSLTAEVMTYDEIVAAGIDTSDPANSHVVKNAFVLEFMATPELAFEIPVVNYTNSTGSPVGRGSRGTWYEFEIDSEDGSATGGSIVWDNPIPLKVGVFPISERFYLVIYGETHWLKEMFNVELIVINNSYAENITDCIAELELPDGLSLASMLVGGQSPVVGLGDIGSIGNTDGLPSQVSTNWYVRGDKEGEYNLTANVTGNFTQDLYNKTPFSTSFTTNSPIKVYAGSALKLSIAAQDTAYYNTEYYVQFKLQNVSDRTLYNVTFGLTGSEQYRAQVQHRGEEGDVIRELDKLSEEHFDDAFYTVEEFKPGDAITINFCTKTLFLSEEWEAFADKLEFINIAYKLQNFFVLTLEGSTTEIPYEFEVIPVAKQSFGEWLWDQTKDNVVDSLKDGALEAVDAYFFGGIPVSQSVVKVFEYHLDEYEKATNRADSYMTISLERGAYFDTGAATWTANSSQAGVAVYTDGTYDFDADGNMRLYGDGKLYIKRTGETVDDNGEEIEPEIKVTTHYVDGMGEIQQFTYSLLEEKNASYIPDEEGNNLVIEQIHMDLPVGSDVTINQVDDVVTVYADGPMPGDVSMIRFPYMLLNGNGDLVTEGSNLSWSVTDANGNVVSDDDSDGVIELVGMRLDNGVLIVTEEVAPGNYTVTLQIADAQPGDDTLSTAVCQTFTMIPKVVITANNQTICVGKEMNADDYILAGSQSADSFAVSLTVWDQDTLVEDVTLLSAGQYTIQASYKTVDGYIILTNSGVLTISEHLYESTVTEPTCTEQGYTTHTCSSCADVYTDTYVDALGHDFQNYVSDNNATYTEDGTKTAKCERCDVTDTVTDVGSMLKLAQPKIAVSNRASDGKPTITWSSVEGATGYQVWRCNSKSGTYTKLAVTTASKLSVTHTGATFGNDYFYKVCAVNDSQVGEFSEIKGVWCDLKQPTITVTNRASDGKPTISWNAVEGATGYEVYYCGTSTGVYKKLYTATESKLSITHVGAAVGNDYFYKVRAIYSTNTSCNSAYSTVKGVWVDLGAPVIKVVNSVSSGKPVISWSKLAYATGYKVYCATGSSSAEYKLIYTTTKPDKISVTHTGAKAGVAYFYKVVATHSNSKCTSAFSTAKGVYCDLARPTLTVTLNSNNKPYLSWTAVNGASGYKVYCSTNGGTYKLIYTASSTKLNVTHVGAKAGNEYAYKVIALCSTNSKGNSSYSAVQTVTIK